jgi:hypothetical protein
MRPGGLGSAFCRQLAWARACTQACCSSFPTCLRWGARGGRGAGGRMQLARAQPRSGAGSWGGPTLASIDKGSNARSKQLSQQQQQQQQQRQGHEVG